MIHPHTTLEFIGPEKGIGVVATEFIPKGTITWACDHMDRIITPGEMDAEKSMFRNFMDKYCYRDHTGNYILCWDHARFVNHSFNSNCISTPYNFEVAVRDIFPGEELTDDYGYLNVLYPIPFPKEGDSMRTIVYPDDLLHYHELWDAQLASAFRKFNIVDQPLWELIDSKYMQKVRAVAMGQDQLDSIINCYYDPKSSSIAA